MHGMVQLTMCSVVTAIALGVLVGLALYVAKFTPATDWGGVSQSLIFHQAPPRGIRQTT